MPAVKNTLICTFRNGCLLSIPSNLFHNSQLSHYIQDLFPVNIALFNRWDFSPELVLEKSRDSRMSLDLVMERLVVPDGS